MPNGSSKQVWVVVPQPILSSLQPYSRSINLQFATHNFPLQTLAIDKWNTDSVEEFLDIYLIKAGLNIFH